MRCQLPSVACLAVSYDQRSAIIYTADSQGLLPRPTLPHPPPTLPPSLPVCVWPKTYFWFMVIEGSWCTGERNKINILLLYYYVVTSFFIFLSILDLYLISRRKEATKKTHIANKALTRYTNIPSCWKIKFKDRDLESSKRDDNSTQFPGNKQSEHDEKTKVRPRR